MGDTFLQLLRIGLGQQSDLSNEILVDWHKMKALAERNGLSAIILDGVEKIPSRLAPPKDFLLQWIGEVVKSESIYNNNRNIAFEIAQLFDKNYIRTYELKGSVVSECYPKPKHRVSSDFDCYLKPVKSGIDAWILGNDIMEAQGSKVNYEFYKNSSFTFHGQTVENHKYLVPFRGNKVLEKFELLLQSLISEDKGEDRIGESCLCRPPVMVSALFLIEHAYSHFLHEGLMWRHILDWMMFRQKHKDEIDWGTLEDLIDEYGFRKFYDSYYRLGQYLLGEISEDNLVCLDKKMLADVWGDLDLHETIHGIKGKLALVGNTWRARWKYQYYSNISMMQALWIQIKGYLFMKNPRLN